MVYLYIANTYMTILIMQFLSLNETFTMIGHSILANNVNFVEIGLEYL